MTAEQVCRILNAICSRATERMRGTGPVRQAAEVVRYHQRRNEQATHSHKKRPHKCIL